MWWETWKIISVDFIKKFFSALSSEWSSKFARRINFILFFLRHFFVNLLFFVKKHQSMQIYNLHIIYVCLFNFLPVFIFCFRRQIFFLLNRKYFFVHFFNMATFIRFAFFGTKCVFICFHLKLLQWFLLSTDFC